MLNRTAIALIIVGLALTTFQRNVYSDPQDFQYGTTVLMEGAGVALSTAMAKGAFAAGHPWQGAAFTAAAIGTAGAMGMTIYNWLQADQSGDPNSPGGNGGPGDGSVPPPSGLPDPLDLGFDDLPTDLGDDSTSNGDGFASDNTSNNKNGNADVALDLLNPDPDSGFGAASLANGRDLASGGSDGSIGAAHSASFDKKNGAALLADAVEKELSSWNPNDIAKLRAGDESLIGSLMDSLGMEGNPNGIDFSMFSHMLDGMLNGGKEEPQPNGVLASEFIKNGQLSIFETIKKSTEVAATEFHPKAKIALYQKPSSVIPSAKQEHVIPSAKQEHVIPRPTAVGISPKSAQMPDGAKAPGHDEAKFSMLPRRIGAGDEK